MLHRISIGAAAGCLATAPMTLAMEALFRRLPRREQYPLPPSEITTELAHAAGIQSWFDPQTHTAVTLLNHFGYGAAAGSLYGVIAPRLPGPPAARGIGWGLLVWSVSYLGLLPASGILRSATDHPARRNLLMIAAHVVWGAALGVLVARWQRR